MIKINTSDYMEPHSFKSETELMLILNGDCDLELTLAEMRVLGIDKLLSMTEYILDDED